MIDIQGVTKRYGQLLALDNLTLNIGPGEVFGFIGPNGAGKSTTMKILAGLLNPDTGSASVCGYDTRSQAAQIKLNLGYMPDFLGVYDDLTVDEYLQFFAAAFKIERARRKAVVDSVLELTDLTAKRHAMVDSLSRGMQQRLGVARVLIHEPKVLLLDEPASGLDPRARIELRELLLELRRMGKCIMVSSHILTELAEMCSSIGIIERGKLLFAGSIADAFVKAGAGERVAITLEPVAVSSAPRAVAALRTDGRVASAASDADRIIVDLHPLPDGSSHGHQFIIDALIASGSRVASFTPQPIKLEEAFLRITKGAVN